MYGFETYFIRPDGAKLPIVVNCSLIRDREGNPSAIIQSAADITELRNREEELKASDEFNRLLVENLPVGIWMADEDGRCRLANKELTRLLGWEKWELFGKLSIESPYVCDSGLPYMEKGTVEALTRIWKKTIKNREYAEGEVPFQTKDGGIVIHKGVEIPYEKGKSRLWASTDITKLKKREKELEETKNYLEAVRSSVSEMLYTSKYR
jgi:PAS domain S-box